LVVALHFLARLGLQEVPLPFNRIKVIVHEPIHVNKQNIEQAGARIVRALGGPAGKFPAIMGPEPWIDPKTGRYRSRA
jgi:hypothetical protein